MQNHSEFLLQNLMHPFFYGIVKDEVEDLYRVLLPDPIRTPYPLFQPHRIPWDIIIYHDVAELKVQTLTTCLCRDHHISLAGKAFLSTTSLFKVHRSIQADHRETPCREKILHHLLRGYKLCENQKLQVGVVLFPTHPVHEIYQHLCLGIRSLVC